MKIGLLKHNRTINRAMFKASAVNGAIFIADLNKAIIETMAPKIYITGANPTVSSISLSAAIIELIALLVINDSNTNKIKAPTGRDGSINPIDVIFWFFKRYSLSSFSAQCFFNHMLLHLFVHNLIPTVHPGAIDLIFQQLAIYHYSQQGQSYQAHPHQ